MLCTPCTGLFHAWMFQFISNLALFFTILDIFVIFLLIIIFAALSCLCSRRSNQRKSHLLFGNMAYSDNWQLYWEMTSRFIRSELIHSLLYNNFFLWKRNSLNSVHWLHFDCLDTQGMAGAHTQDCVGPRDREREKGGCVTFVVFYYFYFTKWFLDWIHKQAIIKRLPLLGCKQLGLEVYA